MLTPNKQKRQIHYTCQTPWYSRKTVAQFMRTEKILILTCILFVYGCSTKQTDTKTISSPNETLKKEVQTVKSDSNFQYNVIINDTFFFRRATKPFIDMVFINKNRNNKFYQELQEEENIDISYIYDFFKPPFKKTNTSLLPDKWIEIISYNGEFYVYPSSNDWYNINRFIISDSMFITCLSDPYIQPLKSLKKVSKNKFELTFFALDFQTKNKVEAKMNIYEIDKKRQIFLFESFNSNDSSLYYFGTPIKNVFSFDLIDIKCERKSFAGVNEDKINYKKLINTP